MKFKIVLLIALLSNIQISFSQSTFQNLNFEQANPVFYGNPPSGYTTTSAFPYWQAFYGSTSTPVVGYDAISAGSTLISLVDNNAGFGYNAIAGNYSAVLFAANGVSASLSQIGSVQNGTESLLFDASVFGGPFVVALGGQILQPVALQAFTGYTLYGANIPSSLVGSDEALTFTETAPAVGGPNSLELDNISFSTIAVPEPSLLELTAIGGLFIGARKWLARSR